MIMNTMKKVLGNGAVDFPGDIMKNKALNSRRSTYSHALSVKWIVPFVLVVILAAIMSGCRPPAREEEQAVAIPVEVIEVKEEHLEESTVLVGVLDAFRSVDIVPEVSGKLETIHHDVGAAVASGTVLATLDNTVYRETMNQAEAALLAAKARFELARDDYSRDSTLIASGDIAKAVYDASRMAYTSAQADLDAARATRELAAYNFRETKVRAPFTGIVTRRFGDAGAYVNPGTPLFRIVDIDSLRLNLSVAQKHVVNLSPGNMVTIVAEALGDRSFSGKIRSLSPEADEATRTFPVEVVLENPTGNPLRAGMVVRATLVLGVRDQSVAVPRESVISRTGGEFVFVVEDTIAIQRAVTLGPMIEDRYVIESGVEPGDLLVTVGVQNLSDSTAVILESDQAESGEGGTGS
jgi:RND family efflux transporter MFP subunit